MHDIATLTFETTESGLLVPSASGAPARRAQVHRRAFLGAAAAGAIGMTLPREADANPLVWAAARWVGGVVVGWLIGKLLDHVWDTETKRQAIEPYIKPAPNPEYTPTGRRTYTEGEGHAVDVRFGDSETFAGPDDDDKLYRIPKPMLSTLQNERISSDHMFMNWGAPTDGAHWRELDDGGFLGGQWYSQMRQRYVVMRVFADPDRSPAYLSCINDYAQSAHDVVRYNKKRLAGPRLADLIDRPWLYKFDRDADSPSNAKT
jgi:hypothetical protein